MWHKKTSFKFGRGFTKYNGVGCAATFKRWKQFGRNINNGSMECAEAGPPLNRRKCSLANQEGGETRPDAWHTLGIFYYISLQCCCCGIVSDLDDDEMIKMHWPFFISISFSYRLLLLLLRLIQLCTLPTNLSQIRIISTICSAVFYVVARHGW